MTLESTTNKDTIISQNITNEESRVYAQETFNMFEISPKLSDVIQHLIRLDSNRKHPILTAKEKLLSQDFSSNGLRSSCGGSQPFKYLHQGDEVCVVYTNSQEKWQIIEYNNQTFILNGKLL